MKKMLHSHLFFFLFLGACGIVSMSLLANIQRSLSRKAGLKKMQQEIAHLKEENSALSEQIEKSKDPVTREKRIRDELNYSLPDEVIVQLSRPTATAAPLSSLKPLPTKSSFQPPITQWINFFFPETE